MIPQVLLQLGYHVRYVYQLVINKRAQRRDIELCTKKVGSPSTCLGTIQWISVRLSTSSIAQKYYL